MEAGGTFCRKPPALSPLSRSPPHPQPSAPVPQHPVHACARTVNSAARAGISQVMGTSWVLFSLSHQTAGPWEQKPRFSGPYHRSTQHWRGPEWVQALLIKWKRRKSWKPTWLVLKQTKQVLVEHLPYVRIWDIKTKVFHWSRPQYLLKSSKSH